MGDVRLFAAAGLGAITLISAAAAERRREDTGMGRWKTLLFLALGTGQFFMVGYTSVMNVPISQLANDIYTDIAAIQA